MAVMPISPILRVRGLLLEVGETVVRVAARGRCSLSNHPKLLGDIRSSRGKGGIQMLWRRSRAGRGAGQQAGLKCSGGSLAASSSSVENCYKLSRQQKEVANLYESNVILRWKEHRIIHNVWLKAEDILAKMTFGSRPQGPINHNVDVNRRGVQLIRGVWLKGLTRANAQARITHAINRLYFETAHWKYLKGVSRGRYKNDLGRIETSLESAHTAIQKALKEFPMESLRQRVPPNFSTIY